MLKFYKTNLLCTLVVKLSICRYFKANMNGLLHYWNQSWVPNWIVHYCNFSLLFFLEKRHLYSVKHKSWCLCRFFKRKNRFPSREILYSPQLRPLWVFPNLDITIIMIWEQLIAPLIKKAIVAWWCDSHKIEGAHKKVSLSFQEC